MQEPAREALDRVFFNAKRYDLGRVGRYKINQRLGLRANVRAEFNGKIPPGITDTSLQPAYRVGYAQINKTFARKGPYAVSAWAQVSNIFYKKDIFRRQTCPATGAPAGCQEGRPLNGALDVLQVWIAPRTFQGGITIDMDWTH
mgnify:CR=1 FL=1